MAAGVKENCGSIINMLTNPLFCNKMNIQVMPAKEIQGGSTQWPISIA
jgi:hypothetical protein